MAARRSILERERELAALAAAAEQAAAGNGSIVLVSGEAGIGKSSLVQAVRSQLRPEDRLLVGYCDDLATRRTLGPFRDLAGDVGTELAEAVQDAADRDRVLPRCAASWPGPTSRRFSRSRTSTGRMRPPWTRCAIWCAALPTCLRSSCSHIVTTS